MLQPAGHETEAWGGVIRQAVGAVGWEGFAGDLSGGRGGNSGSGGSRSGTGTTYRGDGSDARDTPRSTTQTTEGAALDVRV